MGRGHAASAPSAPVTGKVLSETSTAIGLRLRRRTERSGRQSRGTGQGGRRCHHRNRWSDNFEQDPEQEIRPDRIRNHCRVRREPASGGDMAAMHAGIAKAVDVGPLNVAKAGTGCARSGSQHPKAVLQGKPVVVRGKVVKFARSPRKNWVICDGSGSAADGSNDILNDDAGRGEDRRCRAGEEHGSNRPRPWLGLFVQGLIEEAKLQN